MRELTPGRLALSPGLHSADPAAIGRWATAAAAGAQALTAAAARFSALCAQLPTGLWVSPAALVFAGTGSEQVRRLRITAALMQDLAAVAGGLASQLQCARDQAVAALARGARLDADVEAFNHRQRLQHALRPQDPDSLLVSDPEAQELSAQLAATAGDLADAEAQARRAWQLATAAFDRVSYATPAMRQRMLTAAWDPAASVKLAAAGAPALTSCGPMEPLGLPANGVITGPDGRAYPLVVQSALGSDGRLLVTTRGQPADQAGWTQLVVRVGTTAYGYKAATWEKIAVALGGAAGASYPQGSTFAPGLLGRLRVLAGGGAYLPNPAKAPGNPVKEASADPPRGKDLASYWIAPESGLAGGRRAAIPDAIGLLDGALSGYLLARHLDDGRAADYRVVFEENAQGALRARLQLYRVLNVPGDSPHTLAAGGYVDSSGHLAGIPVTGEAPGIQPIMTAAGS